MGIKLPLRLRLIKDGYDIIGYDFEYVCSIYKLNAESMDECRERAHDLRHVIEVGMANLEEGPDDE